MRHMTVKQVGEERVISISLPIITGSQDRDSRQDRDLIQRQQKGAADWLAPCLS